MAQSLCCPLGSFFLGICLCRSQGLGTKVWGKAEEL